MTVKKDHRGLSPSSLTLFTTCARRYYHKKILNTPIDADASEEMEAFDVGKAFHQILEDCKHELNGVSGEVVKAATAKYNLTEEYHFPLIFSMLSKYKAMHAKSGLKALACEIEIDTDKFYGFVDVVLENKDGSQWWIGDMKTAASYSPGIVPGLPLHPQLNLYAAHYMYIAGALDLDPQKFAGCRYRMTTKSKIIRKEGEDTPSYIGRLSKTIKSLDFILPKEIMNPDVIDHVHSEVFKYIEETKGKSDPTLYPPNYSNCMQYFRPCAHWSQCHSGTYSSLLALGCVSSD
jgi:hypothetical protein